MPYVYLVQPVEFINTNCYKVGMSSKDDINILKSYGRGTEYINYFKCTNYQEAERELINSLNKEETVVLFKGREYFCGNKSKILSIFKTVMDKYMEREINLLEKQDIARDIEKNNKQETREDSIININKESNRTKSQTTGFTIIVDSCGKNTFYCDACCFSGESRTEFDRHLNFKIHIQRAFDGNYCIICLRRFSNKINRDMHEKVCNTINNILSTNQNNKKVIMYNLEDVKTFVMSFDELSRKRTTDRFQEFILDTMSFEKNDLMNYIENFDIQIELEQAKIVNEHNCSCYIYLIVKKVDENGEEYEEEIKANPLTHPEIQWKCQHVQSEFKLKDDDISNILANTLLDDNIVVTHDNNIHGKTDLLFKYQSNLHNDNILMYFISKSTKLNCFDLSEDFKPATQIQKDYPEYYDKLEEKAKNIMQAFGRKSKKK